MDGLRTTLDAISHVLDVYNVGRIEATSRRLRSDGRVSGWQISTHTRDRSWVITDADGGTVTSAEDDRRNWQTSAAGDRQASSGIAPIPIRLCYPLDLPVWGRSDDAWSIDHADSTDTGYTVSLAHARSGRRSASLDYSTEFGLVTRFSQYQEGALIAELSLVDITRPGRRSFSDGSVMLAT